ncbi:hypothetical protein [Peribacillus kribbensis]|uniref:hypothetical protein n=1 Tax=Peribacillus kribbensis TaxID=356658 RepID=UPI00047C4F7D|nr:hypothetical protein [Peribacillus kribbensis]
MANAVIYYKLDDNESTKQAVPRVNALIEQLQTPHVIRGVYIDLPGSSNELMELLNSSLTEIDIIYVNKEIEDEFDITLISELSRRDHFEVILLD